MLKLFSSAVLILVEAFALQQLPSVELVPAYTDEGAFEVRSSGLLPPHDVPGYTARGGIVAMESPAAPHYPSRLLIDCAAARGAAYPWLKGLELDLLYLDNFEQISAKLLAELNTLERLSELRLDVLGPTDPDLVAGLLGLNGLQRLRLLLSGGGERMLSAIPEWPLAPDGPTLGVLFYGDANLSALGVLCGHANVDALGIMKAGRLTALQRREIGQAELKVLLLSDWTPESERLIRLAAKNDVKMELIHSKAVPEVIQALEGVRGVSRLVCRNMAAALGRAPALDDDCLEVITALHGLDVLEISMGGTFTSAAVSGLQSLGNLRILRLQLLDVRGGLNLGVLNHLPRLVFCECSDMQVSVPVVTKTSAAEIVLSNSLIDEGGLRKISGQQALFLDVASNPLERVGLEAGKWKVLSVLDIQSTKVDRLDAGEDLPPGLSWVVVSEDMCKPGFLKSLRDLEEAQGTQHSIGYPLPEEWRR